MLGRPYADSNDLRLIKSIQDVVAIRHLPLVTFASGWTTLADKFVSLIHAFALEAGTGPLSLPD